MGFADLAAFIEAREILRGGGCAWVGASLHDARVECAGAAAQGVERKRGGDVGGVDKRVGFEQREAEKREHALRAVEEREAFFGFERDGRDSGALHGDARRREFRF